MFLRSIERFILDDSNYVNINYYYLRIYRWNPHFKTKPWFHIFPLKLNHENTFMVLDLLFEVKDWYDSSLTFRRSCREGICGSCAMNINGLNTLACLKSIRLKYFQFMTIYPLPNFAVIKDLVCDLTNFYNQLKLIKPWLNRRIVSREHLQSKKDRFELDGLYECVFCACCSSSCPSYWWNYNKYLGPAVLLQSFKWILDSRDLSTYSRVNFLKNKFRVSKCHSILNCSKTCPKNLNPAGVINYLKKIT